MTDRPETSFDDDDFMAAEYVLGLATGDDLTAVRERVRHDGAFAQRVAGWQERLVRLTDDIDPVAPPKRVRKAILAEIFPKVRVPLSQRLWIWQGLTVAALALAAFLAMPFVRPTPPAPGPQVYATHMVGDVDDLEVLAVYDPAVGDLALRRLAGAAPADRVLELWAILPDQQPISLGVLPADETARVRLPLALASEVGRITLAISDEPQGGAPQGAPTGDIRAVGAISEL